MENEILQAYLEKLELDKIETIEKIKTADFLNINKVEAEEKYVFPFQNKYILSKPKELESDNERSSFFVIKAIEAYLEIRSVFDETFKKKNEL